jgi:hypothetical protein
VLEISREVKDGRTHSKIRLSMKDAAQDGSGKDLSEERASGEATKHHLTLSLNSAIGMGVAMDPMAIANNSSNLVLKSDGTKRSNLINGYALVDDDEGEPPATEPAHTLKPMGRGRGSTLPSWMTQSSGPSGINDENEERKKRKERKRQSKKERTERKQDRKRHREEVRHDRKHRRRSIDSDADNRRKARRQAGIESVRPHGDACCGSESEEDQRRWRQGNERKRKRRGLESNGKDFLFETVEDANQLIAKLEAEGQRP